jgi:hypothetical protein
VQILQVTLKEASEEDARPILEDLSQRLRKQICFYQREDLRAAFVAGKVDQSSPHFGHALASTILTQVLKIPETMPGPPAKEGSILSGQTLSTVGYAAYRDPATIAVVGAVYLSIRALSVVHHLWARQSATLPIVVYVAFLRRYLKIKPEFEAARDAAAEGSIDAAGTPESGSIISWAAVGVLALILSLIFLVAIAVGR